LQLFERTRFGEDGVNARLHAGFTQGSAVPSEQEDGLARGALPYLLGQLQAVHPRQAQVGDHKVVTVLLEELQGCFAVVGDFDAVLGHVEQMAQSLGEDWFVLHKQN
jgi:hypothetical protein